MNGPRSHIVSILLAALIAVTSTQMAVARAGMSLHGMTVLCIGSEVVTVPLGPDGLPQETRHSCPDCVVGDLALMAVPALRLRHVTSRSAGLGALPQTHTPLPEIAALARAPPFALI